MNFIAPTPSENHIMQQFQQMIEASRQPSPAVLCMGAIGLFLLAGIFFLLLWQALASRRERTLQRAIAGQMTDVQARVASVEKMLSEVG